jgi:hypothetical protein
MIEFLKKNQKNLTMSGALALLLLCYFQRREINKLRNENKKIEMQNIDEIKTDSLSNEFLNGK